MKWIPRDYQEAGDEALWQFVHNHPDKNPLVVIPTGGGKSGMMGMFCWRMLAAYPHLRMMNVTHVKELVKGNYEALKTLWPRAPAGIYSAGLGHRETRAQVTFAGIMSVVNRAADFGRIDFLIIDEAHRISETAKTSYRKFIDALRKTNPNLIVVGFTATAFRMGLGCLTEEGGLFDEIAFDLSSGEAFVWMLQNHYLIRPVPRNPGFQLDSSGISVVAGEFHEGQASSAMHDQNILERAVDNLITTAEADGRQSWLIFCQSIEDSEEVADMLRFKGYPVEAVHSKRGDRDEVLEKFKRGELRGVTNKDILTTGFDNPRIDLIAMLRLTRSPGLWVQMLGRGTRPCFAPGFDITTWEGRRDAILASHKQTCLVLDYVGNTERLGPINYPRIPKRRGAGSGDPPVRECPACGTYNHISLKCCEECGYEFPVEEKIKEKPSSKDLVLDLSVQPPPREHAVFEVESMICQHHRGKDGKPDTMRVDYFCGIRRFSTWVCFEHPAKSFPRRKAEDWWIGHGGQGPAPLKIADALSVSSDLSLPRFIKVWVNTRYPEIVDYDFRGTRFELPPELGGPPLAPPLRNRVEEELAKTGLNREDFYGEIPF